MRRRHAVLFMVLTALGFGPRRVWAQGDRKLGPAEVQSALDDFKVALDERWSYRHANRADFDAAIAALRKKAAAGMSIDGFGLELHKILALGIDGHSRVAGYELPGRRYLPFLVEPAGERFIAFKAVAPRFSPTASPT